MDLPSVSSENLAHIFKVQFYNCASFFSELMWIGRNQLGHTIPVALHFLFAIYATWLFKILSKIIILCFIICRFSIGLFYMAKN
jgi:hypothetical protein